MIYKLIFLKRDLLATITSMTAYNYFTTQNKLLCGCRFQPAKGTKMQVAQETFFTDF